MRVSEVMLSKMSMFGCLIFDDIVVFADPRKLGD